MKDRIEHKITDEDIDFALKADPSAGPPQHIDPDLGDLDIDLEDE